MLVWVDTAARACRQRCCKECWLWLLSSRSEEETQLRGRPGDSPPKGSQSPDHARVDGVKQHSRPSPCQAQGTLPALQLGSSFPQG